jgi:hypothetical protein
LSPYLSKHSGARYLIYIFACAYAVDALAAGHSLCVEVVACRDPDDELMVTQEGKILGPADRDPAAQVDPGEAVDYPATAASERVRVFLY